MEALILAACIFLMGGILWTGRVLLYALSDQYKIDQRSAMRRDQAVFAHAALRK